MNELREDGGRLIDAQTEPARLAAWRGKPIVSMSRDELVEALEWCCQRMESNRQEAVHMIQTLGGRK